MSFRTWMDDRSLRRYAREDASSNEYDPLGAVTAVHGACPEYNPHDVNTQNVEVRVAETRISVQTNKDDLHRTENAMTEHVNPSALRIGLAVAGIAESVGTCMQLRDWGVKAPDRYVLAVPFAMFLFMMIALVVKLGTTQDEDGKARRSWWVPFVYGTVVMLFISMAVARVASMSTTDAFTWLDAAGSVFMLAIVLGPSVVAEHSLTKLRAVAPLERKKSLLKRRLRVEQEQYVIAVGTQEATARERQVWRNQAARSERVYRREFRNAGGNIPPDAMSVLALTQHDTPQPVLMAPPLAHNTPLMPGMTSDTQTNTVVLPPGFSFPQPEQDPMPVQHPDPHATGPLTMTSVPAMVKPNGKLPEVIV